MFLVKLFVFLIIISYIAARLEINIEGKDGWALNLPTWKIKNRWTKWLYGELPLTGYHVWFMAFVFIFLQFPFFTGIKWSLSLELKYMALFSFFWMIEDFFWFVLNPSYGIKKFSKKHIPWHYHWRVKVPTAYFKFFIVGTLLLLLSNLI